MEEDESRIENSYTHCGVDWSDVWNCACNDKCPVCNAEIEPYYSENLDTGEVYIDVVPEGHEDYDKD